MQIKNTQTSYGFVAKLFHWFIAIAIIGLLIVGFNMSSMEASNQKWQLYFLHKSLGVTILILVVLRLTWRLTNTQPDLPFDLPLWQKAASKITHYLLYLLMLVMPLSGIMMSRYGGYEINVFNLFIIPPFAEKKPELGKLFYEIHEISAFILSGLICVHILAGLYHHFIRKDYVLSRML